MHRFSYRVKRDLLRPQTLDYAHGTTGTEVEAQYLQDLRRRLESLDGEEIRERMERVGPDALYDAIGATKEELREWAERVGEPGGGERLERVREDAFRRFWEGRGGGEQGASKETMSGEAKS